MRSRLRLAISIGTLLGLGLVGCTAPQSPPNASKSLSPTAAPPTDTPTPTPAPVGTPMPKPVPTATAGPNAPRTARTGPDDPRWQFFTADRTRYRSPWFEGAQRIMIDYGCTTAPFYVPDPRCRGDNGFHHGIDVALPCRTVLRAGVAGQVVDPDRPGRPGPAYGSTAFRLRVLERNRSYDVLIGHAARVLVRPGDRVRPGQRIALAGARGSPDGCHLHFEQRRPDGGVSTARNPGRLLALTPT